MSTKYRIADQIPSPVICNRLEELSDAVTKGPDAVRRAFDMRVPAECDRDADLVLSAAAKRIRDLENCNRCQLEDDPTCENYLYGIDPGSPEGDKTVIWDLDAEFWKQIKQAARNSSWIPEEYVMNDWVSDVCHYLRGGEII